MARVLIVGCGCRGAALASALVAGGHVVRGTTRDPARAPDIAAAGAQPWIGDPLRLATMTRALDGVTIACWMLGSARGDAADLAALHGERLTAYLREIVDTTVRGFVYEVEGTVDGLARQRGREIVARMGDTWQLPVAFLEAGPADSGDWVARGCEAVETLLATMPSGRRMGSVRLASRGKGAKPDPDSGGKTSG